MPAQTGRAELSRLSQFTPRLRSLHRICTHNTLKHNPSSYFPSSSFSPFYVLLLIWTPQCFKNAPPLSHTQTQCLLPASPPWPIIRFPSLLFHFHLDLNTTRPPSDHHRETHKYTTSPHPGILQVTGKRLDWWHTFAHPSRPLNMQHTQTHTWAHTVLKSEKQCNIQAAPAITLQLWRWLFFAPSGQSSEPSVLSSQFGPWRKEEGGEWTDRSLCWMSVWKTPCLE